MTFGAAYGTASDIELLWTLLALVGLVFSVVNLREAWIDYRVLCKARVSNGRLVLAKALVKSEGARALKQIIFMAIGGLALWLPEAPPHSLPLKLDIAGFLIRWGLISASGLTTYQSYLAYRVRTLLMGN